MRTEFWLGKHLDIREGEERLTFRLRVDGFEVDCGWENHV